MILLGAAGVSATSSFEAEAADSFEAVGAPPFKMHLHLLCNTTILPDPETAFNVTHLFHVLTPFSRIYVLKALL